MWTIPNILTILRLLLIAPAGWFLWNGHNTTAGILAIIGSIFDISDGYIARKFNQISELGKILDPLADKLFFFTLAGILLLQGRAPLWFVSVLVIRDLLLMFGGLYAAKKLTYVIPAAFAGKITACVVGATLLFMVFNLDFAKVWGPWISLIFLIYSFAFYVLNMLKQFKQAGIK